MNQSITSCEIAFKKCFSKWAETDQLIRFSDPELPDMYDHNMTLIKTHGMTTIDILIYKLITNAFVISL